MWRWFVFDQTAAPWPQPHEEVLDEHPAQPEPRLARPLDIHLRQRTVAIGLANRALKCLPDDLTLIVEYRLRVGDGNFHREVSATQAKRAACRMPSNGCRAR